MAVVAAPKPTLSRLAIKVTSGNSAPAGRAGRIAKIVVYDHDFVTVMAQFGILEHGQQAFAQQIADFPVDDDDRQSLLWLTTLLPSSYQGCAHREQGTARANDYAVIRNVAQHDRSPG